MTNNSAGEVKCCPEFNPAPWEDKLFEWEHKKFVKASIVYAGEFWRCYD